MADRRATARPDAAQSVPEDLPRLLAKLSAAPGAGAEPEGRPLGEGEAALAALLEEVDETVMARRLMLVNAAGEEIGLDVCNRRLLRAGVPGGAAPLGGDTLTYAGLEDLAALRARLARFCAGGARVRTTRPEGGATLEQTGVAVATLRHAWGLPAGEDTATRSPREPDVRAFCAALSDCALAAAMDFGNGVERHGPPGLSARLAALLESSAAALPGSGAEALLLAGSPGAPALVLARDARGRAALAISAEDTGAVAALWRDTACT